VTLSIPPLEVNGPILVIPPIDELNISYGLHIEPAEGYEAGGLLDPIMLVRLHLFCLRSEFAYRFEFGMLQGCPSIAYLELDMLTGGSRHPRALTRADLFATSSNTDITTGEDPSTEPPTQQRRIVAPNMTRLRMTGQRVMDDALLTELLTGMFPNLRYFMEKGWSKIILQEVITSIHPELK